MRRILLLAVFAILLLADYTLFKPPFRHSFGINKGDQANLRMLLGRSAAFSNPQGLAAVRRHDTNEPTSMDDAELTVYGVNSGRGQIIYNRSMRALDTFGKVGSRDGEFKNPHGIAAREDGKVIVADTGNRRVQVLNHGRRGLRFQRVIGEGILKEPFDVKITPTDTIFVTDKGTNSIHVFNLDGKHLGEIGKNKLIAPTGLDIDHPNLFRTRYRSSTIFVIDSLGKRINKMSYSGKLLRRRRLADYGYVNGVVSYCALDFDNNLYLPDTIMHTIHKLDDDLRHLKSTGKYGHDNALEFNHPRGIDIWRHLGQVFISERESAQYYWLGVDVDRLEVTYQGDSLSERIVIEVFLTQKAYYTLDIKGPGGFEHRLSETKRRFQHGSQRLDWDLRDSKGRRVPAGEYTFDFVFEPTYSAYTFLEIPKKRTVKVPESPVRIQ